MIRAHQQRTPDAGVADVVADSDDRLLDLGVHEARAAGDDGTLEGHVVDPRPGQVARSGVERPLCVVEVERRIGLHHVHVRLVERTNGSDVAPVAAEEMRLDLARANRRRQHVFAEVVGVVVQRIAELRAC